MTTGTIVAIVIAALIVIAVLAFAMSRSRATARERLVRRRREEVAGAHREVAEERAARADRAERMARAERADAEAHTARADLHEQGLADDDLEQEHRRFVREDGDTVADGQTAGETRRPPR
jgi:biopolymer transport protein ExbB/TolQ